MSISRRGNAWFIDVPFAAALPGFRRVRVSGAPNRAAIRSPRRSGLRPT